MVASPALSRIWIYPIKSLEGVSVQAARITSGGSLSSDREFALIDEIGKVVNAKRTAQIHKVRSQFDLEQRVVTLSTPTVDTQTFHLDRDRNGIENWFSTFFGFKIQLIQNLDMGFPDDPVASGPTVISEATLAAVASWYEGMSINEVRSRFRTNLEISNVEAFWEDRLFSEPSLSQGFKIGEVAILGSNPCQRCIVPTRNPQTGEAWPQFQKILAENRKTSLPTWADASRFNHYYRLAVNTKISPTETNKELRVFTTLNL